MTAAITLMEAYLIETPLSQGMSKKTLLEHLQAAEADKLNEFVGRFNYKDLVQAYNEQKENITAAIEIGYTVKFVSIAGIERLLELKFGLDGEKDFETYGNKVLGIPLNEQQCRVFKEMLSPNWKIIKGEKDTVTGINQINVYHNTLDSIS